MQKAAGSLHSASDILHSGCVLQQPVTGSNSMRMTRIEKRFVNDIGHSRRVADEAVRRLRHVPVQPGWSYLDIGCGNGAAAMRVADTFGMRVVGIDVDPQQIALARSATGDRTDVLFMTADATCLPFDDRRFDIVATNKATHHVPQWSSAIAEMRRVLKRSEERRVGKECRSKQSQDNARKKK